MHIRKDDRNLSSRLLLSPYVSIPKTQDFAKKLKDIREGKGLSQSEVSKALGMTRNAFTNYEAGIREPSLDTLKLICQVLDVSADYLLGLTDNEVNE